MEFTTQSAGIFIKLFAMTQNLLVPLPKKQSCMETTTRDDIASYLGHLPPTPKVADNPEKGLKFLHGTVP